MTSANYLAREAAASAAINALISAAFFFAFFGGMDIIPIWGFGGYVLDFAPQSFAVAFMSALVPGFLARKALAAGNLGMGRVPDPSFIVLRAMGIGIAGLLSGTAMVAAILWLSAISTIPWLPALTIKIVFGAALGALVTYFWVGRLIK